MLVTKELKLSTQYSDSEVPTRARIFYIHGGGLLYGTRKDLPSLHLEKLTAAGYEVVALDYPLAPASKLDVILDELCNLMNQSYDETLPCFLWGRSAGAYLCLLAATSGKLSFPLNGILSFYGYGFLCDDWFCTPSVHYKKLPLVGESCISDAAKAYHTEGSLDAFYSLYVYARQTGLWKELIYEGRDKFFFLDYSLRLKESLPCPLFCAHSTGDPDVPYAEFLELSNRYHAQRFIASDSEHDFDRNDTTDTTKKLLDESISFLNSNL